MKLRLHHIEMCVKHPGKIIATLCHQFGFYQIGKRRTVHCEQVVVQLGKTIFIITTRRKWKTIAISDHENTKGVDHNCQEFSLPVIGRNEREPWTVFCCEDKFSQPHVDSVFNIAIEVEDLTTCMNRLKQMACTIIQDSTVVTSDRDNSNFVKYAIVRSCCGNVVHTIIEKKNFEDWFLPGFEQVPYDHIDSSSSFFDHVTLACHTGDSNSIIKWFQNAFEMKRFMSNRQETEDEGLVIDGDAGMRLKVLEFWKCSEIGLASMYSEEDETPWEILKIVIVESLPWTKNSQVDNFIRDHNGPGLQHIGLHTSTMIDTVAKLVSMGVRFRTPPPTYYTEIGQLNSIVDIGLDPELLARFGILLDKEAGVVDDDKNIETGSIQSFKSSPAKIMYLMQIFTHPIFDRDTFFLEIIQRKGAKGFGVGNISALARSVNAYQAKLRESQQKDFQENNYVR